MIGCNDLCTGPLEVAVVDPSPIECVVNGDLWSGLVPPLSEFEGAVRDEPRPTFC